MTRTANAVSAADGPVNRLEVLSFILEKSYTPALFAAASRELDGDAARLASELSGHLAARSTTEVTGRKARSYRIDYGDGKTQQIVFLLDGKNEFELLCRRRSSATASECAQLFSSFTLG